MATHVIGMSNLPTADHDPHFALLLRRVWGGARVTTCRYEWWDDSLPELSLDRWQQRIAGVAAHLASRAGYTVVVIGGDESNTTILRHLLTMVPPEMLSASEGAARWVEGADDVFRAGWVRRGVNIIDQKQLGTLVDLVIVSDPGAVPAAHGFEVLLLRSRQLIVIRGDGSSWVDFDPRANVDVPLDVEVACAGLGEWE